MGAARQALHGVGGAEPACRWRGFLVLALLAWSVVIARPICDAIERAHPAPESAAVLALGGSPEHHTGDDVACCAALEKVTFVSAAVAASNPAKADALSRHSLLTASPPPQTRASPRSRPKDLFRPVAYYARTARILV